MKNRKIRAALTAICLLLLVWATGCQTSTAPANSPNTDASAAEPEYKTLAPERVDIRGAVFSSRYSEGQVVLEVEGFPSPTSRYNRAYVLVLPTTQIVGPNGQNINLSELRQGLDVAILLRGGGKGNFVGVGIAQKVWLEERY